MEANMCKIMEQSWDNWYGNLNVDYLPTSKSGYEKGFTACHEILMPLLIASMPHVYASAGAAHLTDGFRPQRKKIDELVERIEAVLPE